MIWTEAIKNYPIIQSKYKRKIAAKRRIKASQGQDEALTSKDMEQISNDIIKTIKENLPADIEKPMSYDDVVKGLKGEVGESLGFKPEDFVARNDTEPAGTPYEGITTSEPIVEETVTEELVEAPVETPTEVPVAPVAPVEPDITEGVGNVAKRIADEFKPLTPVINPIPAPMPYQTPYGQSVPRPSVKPDNAPRLGTSKIWDDDLKFW